jgi:YHS domain-containing protein
MRIFVLAALSTIVVPLALAQTTLPYFNVDSKGLWVEGYDPVAYLIDGKPLKGKEQFTSSYLDATFRFASQAHLDLFKKDPSKYLPQYGGWCAYALGANNEKVDVDPETFKIKDGKLFLFYNAFFNNTLTTWNKEERVLYPAAQCNWAAMQHSK